MEWEYSKTLTDKTGRALRTRGELLKKGGSKGGFRRNWQARYFILDVDRGELRYFEDAACMQPKGLVQLTVDTVLKFEAPDYRGKGKNAAHYLELSATKDDKGQPRESFQVRAANSAALDEWTASLDFTLQILRRAHGQTDLDCDLPEENQLAKELADKLRLRCPPPPSTPPPPPPPPPLNK